MNAASEKMQSQEQKSDVFLYINYEKIWKGN
jgi:hypothetical protein